MRQSINSELWIQWDDYTHEQTTYIVFCKLRLATCSSWMSIADFIIPFECIFTRIGFSYIVFIPLTYIDISVISGIWVEKNRLYLILAYDETMLR